MQSVLIELAQAGDREAADELVRRYYRFVCRLCRPYFAKGFEREDVIQEGLIGFHKAIRTYKSGGLSFAGFARMSVLGRLNTMVRAVHRQKNQANLLSFSIEKPVIEDKRVEDMLDSGESLEEIIEIYAAETPEFIPGRKPLSLLSHRNVFALSRSLNFL